MLRQPLLRLSHSARVEDLVTRMPVTSGIVARYVAGETTEAAVEAAGSLVGGGLSVTLDHLGEDTRDLEQAVRAVAAYRTVLEALHAAGLSHAAEVSLKLSALGRNLPAIGEQVALDNAHAVCRAARAAGTAVTLDMEDHTTTDATLGILRELRRDFPETGAVLQAYLRRTLADCRDLAFEGSRVRLCKGAYDEPASVAHRSRADVDRSYVRCLRVLMEGPGYPMVATHDPRLVAIAEALVRRTGRSSDSYEYQMLYGIRSGEQRRLAAASKRVRVYVPYGAQWYPYLMRRLAERPANLALFLRSLVSTS